MKAVRALLLMLIVVCAGGGQFGAPAVASTRPARAQPALSGYVRLADWARANGFEAHWSRTGDAFQLSNRSTQMIFPKDSREAQLGGVHVCLSFPMLTRDGAAYISQTDMETVLRPLLVPPKNPKGTRIKTIVIDPGHGGKDPGNIIGSQQEKKYTLLLAQELSDQLRQAGYKVSLTRASDVFIPLPERPEIARRRAADLFISVHWNELPGNSQMKGAQTFCLTPAGATSSNSGGHGGGAGSPGNRNNGKNVLLAYAMQKSLLNHLGVEDRGVRRARYWILRDATMPAVLIEGGFMSNTSEAKRIYDAGYRRQMAQAIVDGIRTYQHLVE